MPMGLPGQVPPIPAGTARPMGAAAAKRGGKIGPGKHEMRAGAGSGEGRLEKAKGVHYAR
jgi:hypothetical protein